jgi:hypothetical protein
MRAVVHQPTVRLRQRGNGGGAGTGGWDWAPYSTTSQDGINTFSKGIWKSVYVAEVVGAAIMHVVPQIKYAGAYPSSPLTDGAHGGFKVDVRTHMSASETPFVPLLVPVLGMGVFREHQEQRFVAE